MTRDRATLDDLEARRQTAVKNLSAGRRGYAMRAIVAYDVLTQDVPALLELARVAQQICDGHGAHGLVGPYAEQALREALDALKAAKRLAP